MKKIVETAIWQYNESNRKYGKLKALLAKHRSDKADLISKETR